jgi:hypothetical protein
MHYCSRARRSSKNRMFHYHQYRGQSLLWRTESLCIILMSFRQNARDVQLHGGHHNVLQLTQTVWPAVFMGHATDHTTVWHLTWWSVPLSRSPCCTVLTQIKTLRSIFCASSCTVTESSSCLPLFRNIMAISSVSSVIIALIVCVMTIPCPANALRTHSCILRVFLNVQCSQPYKSQVWLLIHTVPVSFDFGIFFVCCIFTGLPMAGA